MKIEELLAKAVTGKLLPKEAEVLLAACREDSALQERLVRLVRAERLMALAASDDGELFAREARCRIETSQGADALEFSAEVAGRLRRLRVTRWVSGIAAAAVLALALVWLMFPARQNSVVEILRVEATDWEPERASIEVGERIRFERGLVELKFLSGVAIVLEAPADFEITGSNSGFLHQGKLVAEVNDETAHGFMIDSPSGRLVDLGTRFAVEVGNAGEMEVHVIEGEVDVTATGGATSRLKKDEAMHLESGRASPVQADVGRFVTRMPAYQDQAPRYLRWSFDELENETFPNLGRDLAGNPSGAERRSFAGGKSGPEQVEAPFGRGVRFDGEDGYLESDYRGITGSQPRTVAFWLRAPMDFERLQGYGIINWGDVREPGGAWQISINATPTEGPEGHLRIGTSRGQVIGTTDLRDSKWHHCAVVMYGQEDGKPNTATHILLYVDGKLEPAARKSVREVDTVMIPDPSERSHGIWMGRNLAFEFEDSPGGVRYGRFFRGDVDEMIICDTALNQAQILRLMEKNEMPE
ncbi:LamG-like jellyroll fold domain-containing protein [Verrucomicrobiaceae bacterium 227]